MPIGQAILSFVTLILKNAAFGQSATAENKIAALCRAAATPIPIAAAFYIYFPAAHVTAFWISFL